LFIVLARTAKIKAGSGIKYFLMQQTVKDFRIRSGFDRMTGCSGTFSHKTKISSSGCVSSDFYKTKFAINSPVVRVSGSGQQRNLLKMVFQMQLKVRFSDQTKQADFESYSLSKNLVLFFAIFLQGKNL
jgi:hypothetical protein